MSKAPTVSDVVSNVVLVGSFAAPPPTPFAHESVGAFSLLPSPFFFFLVRYFSFEKSENKKNRRGKAHKNQKLLIRERGES